MEEHEIPYDELITTKDNGWLLKIDERVIFAPSSICDLDEVSRVVYLPTWLVIKEELEDYLE